MIWSFAFKNLSIYKKLRAFSIKAAKKINFFPIIIKFQEKFISKTASIEIAWEANYTYVILVTWEAK